MRRSLPPSPPVVNVHVDSSKRSLQEAFGVIDSQRLVPGSTLLVHMDPNKQGMHTVLEKLVQRVDEKDCTVVCSHPDALVHCGHKFPRQKFGFLFEHMSSLKMPVNNPVAREKMRLHTSRRGAQLVSRLTEFMCSNKLCHKVYVDWMMADAAHTFQNNPEVILMKRPIRQLFTSHEMERLDLLDGLDKPYPEMYSGEWSFFRFPDQYFVGSNKNMLLHRYVRGKCTATYEWKSVYMKLLKRLFGRSYGDLPSDFRVLQVHFFQGVFYFFVTFEDRFEVVECTADFCFWGRFANLQPPFSALSVQSIRMYLQKGFFRIQCSTPHKNEFLYYLFQPVSGTFTLL